MYRDHVQAAQHRREQILQRQAHEQPGPIYAQLYRARLRRIWGAIAALSAIPGAILWAVQPLRHIGQLLGFPQLENGTEIALVPLWFVGGWALGGLGAAAAHFAAPYLFARAVRGSATTEAGELFRDLEALERHRPTEVAHEVVQRHRKASFALPLVAASLLAPLTLHFLVGAALGVGLEEFATYMGISAMLVGHAHLVLAVLAVRHVNSCYLELFEVPTGARPRSRGWDTLGWTIAASCIPGILFLGIPPLLVALTGAPFVPAMLNWAGRRAWSEELLLMDD